MFTLVLITISVLASCLAAAGLIASTRTDTDANAARLQIGPDA